jgi:hypothetical protein
MKKPKPILVSSTVLVLLCSFAAGLSAEPAVCSAVAPTPAVSLAAPPLPVELFPSSGVQASSCPYTCYQMAQQCKRSCAPPSGFCSICNPSDPCSADCYCASCGG